MAKRVSTPELIAFLTEEQIEGAKVIETTIGSDRQVVNDSIIPWVRYEDLQKQAISPGAFWEGALGEWQPPDNAFRRLRVYRGESPKAADAKPVEVEWWGNTSTQQAETQRGKVPTSGQATSTDQLPLKAWEWSVQTVKDMQVLQAQLHDRELGRMASQLQMSQEENRWLLTHLIKLSQWLQRYQLMMTAIEHEGTGNAEAGFAGGMAADMRAEAQSWLMDHASLISMGADALASGLGNDLPAVSAILRQGATKLNGWHKEKTGSTAEVIDANGKNGQ